MLLKWLLEKNNHEIECVKITYINREKIITEMKNIADFLEKPNNKSIIYYFGHGDQVLDLNNDEIDGKDEIWKTQNILDDEISEIFKNIDNKSRLYLFSDSCSSGWMIDKKINDKPWITVSSCNDFQDWLATWDGGVFTIWGFIPCLYNKVKHEKIFVSCDEIHNYIKNNILIDTQT